MLFARLTHFGGALFFVVGDSCDFSVIIDSRTANGLNSRRRRERSGRRYFAIYSITRATVAIVRRRSRSDLADVLCWATGLTARPQELNSLGDASVVLPSSCILCQNPNHHFALSRRKQRQSLVKPFPVIIARIRWPFDVDGGRRREMEHE